MRFLFRDFAGSTTALIIVGIIYVALAGTETTGKENLGESHAAADDRGSGLSISLKRATPTGGCDDVWAATSLTNAATARYNHTAVWTGSEMIVWGGEDGNGLNTGSKYNPASDTWASTSLTNAPAGRTSHIAVWTGNEMIVWGGYSPDTGEEFRDGAKYNPNTNTWTPISDTTGISLVEVYALH